MVLMATPLTSIPQSAPAHCANGIARLTAALLAMSLLAGPAQADTVKPAAGNTVILVDPQAAPEASTGLTPIQDQGKAAFGRNNMVVAANPMAVDAARAILADGGSAVDAVIAAQWVLGLVEPQSSGLGGGAFLLTYDAATKRVRAFDGRETAPAAVKPEHFLDAAGKPRAFKDVVRTGRSIGVPGVVRMLELAHARHGKLGWQKLFKPAIALAENGFAVPPRLAYLLKQEKPEQFDAAARAYLFNAAGQPPSLGTKLTNPAYAASLKALARGGADAFYEGALAAQITAAARAAGSELTVADLQNYRAKERKPVCVTYRSRKICGMGAPSSGGLTVAMTLKLIEPFDLSVQPLQETPVQTIVEAEKLAFADRDRYVADPDFVSVPSGLLDARYLTQRRNAIDPSKPMDKAEPGILPVRLGQFGVDTTVEASGTSHISVVDRVGNAASMTTSIEAAFGSGVMAGGFLLNNQLTDFSFTPSDAEGRLIANRIAPGKRPRSSMAPTLMFDTSGRLAAVTGSPGGSRIISYVIKSVICLVDWRCGPEGAVAMVNFGSRNGPLEIEKGQDGDALAAVMLARGNKVERPEMTSGLNIIERRKRGWAGASDPRRDGRAAGD
jgi:gamma-glutamyltranspeptidase / glutathione hydrolase